MSMNDTGLGRDPDSARDGTGDPVVVTVNVPATPAVKDVLFALVIVGAIDPVVTVIVRVGGLGSVEPRLSVTVKDATWVPTPEKVTAPGLARELDAGFPPGKTHE